MMGLFYFLSVKDLCLKYKYPVRDLLRWRVELGVSGGWYPFTDVRKKEGKQKQKSNKRLKRWEIEELELLINKRQS